MDKSSAAEQYAPGYDSVLTLVQHASRRAEKQAAFLLPHLRSGMSLLDCGCGSGSITIGLAKTVMPGKTVGIDVSGVEIARARANASNLEMSNILFEVQNVYALDFPDNSFDAVFSHNVLEHLNDPARAVAEMQRVLKPGGVIGIRDADMGGNLVQPPEKLLMDWFALFELDWHTVSGDPRFARRLPQALGEAGLADLCVSASYDVYFAKDARTLFVDVAAARCREKDFVERVLSGGMASLERLEAMRTAWLAAAEQRFFWAAIAHVEVTGRKA
jgi:ubiquinone/menaquinone biosynthesis C-methylase UbiE